MTCGIYMIQNKVNHKIYIGQSVDIEERWGNHRSELRGNHHTNKHLQSSWNRDGEDSFKFTIICECDENQLNTMEEYYILELMSYDRRVGYNKTYGGGGCRATEETKNKISENSGSRRPEVRKKLSEANKGKTLSEECRKKISKSLKGRIISEEHRKKLSENNARYWKGKILSEETRKKISEAEKGRTISEETREKMSRAIKIALNRPEVRKKISESHKGKTISEETRKKMSENTSSRRPEVRRKNSEAHKGENNPNYGKPRSEETRKKISEANKGENNGMYGKFGAENPASIPIVQLSLDGELVKVYDSARAAERKGFAGSKISLCCRGKRKTHKGYKWMYLSDYEAMKREG